MRHTGPGGLETLTLRQGATRVELVPERGALVTRMTVEGEDILFLDEGTLVDRAKNVRGGVPVLFPLAGPLPGDSYAAKGQPHGMPQHGFARRRAWRVLREEDARVVLGLEDSEETLRQYPWRFEARLGFSVDEGRLELDFEVENRDSLPMPVQLGYHPYFRVPQAHKARASVETEATRAWDNRARSEVAFGGWELTAQEVDLHLRDHGRAGTVLHRGEGLRPVRLSWSPEFRTLVVWTLQGRDFVCVEPWTAPSGALATGEGLLTVAPGERLALTFRIEV